MYQDSKRNPGVAQAPPPSERITPQQQLWKETPEQYHVRLASVLAHLKLGSQEDLCLALVAYIRFGIRRTFANQFMDMVFADCIDMLESD